MDYRKIKNRIASNDKIPHEVPEAMGDKVPVKKNEKLSMNKFILLLLVLVLLTCVIGMFGCTAMDPIGDKNVEYVFENFSYESPNSSPHDNIGEAEGRFNFGKKLPIG